MEASALPVVPAILLRMIPRHLIPLFVLREFVAIEINLRGNPFYMTVAMQDVAARLAVIILRIGEILPARRIFAVSQKPAL